MGGRRVTIVVTRRQPSGQSVYSGHIIVVGGGVFGVR